MSTIDDAQIREIVLRVLDRVMGYPSPEAAPSSAPVKVEAILQDKPQASHRQVVAIGADHGGFALKEILKPEIIKAGFEVKDVGAYDASLVDYPDVAHQVASLVGKGTAWRGIMIDGAGIGSCIVANKVPGVRAGMAYDLSSAMNGREHNDTNVLTLGAGLTGVTLAKQIVSTWLATEFGGGRHATRVDKITAVEKQYLKS